MTFFHCFECRKAGAQQQLCCPLMGEARSKRARNESDDCLVLLKTLCVLFKVQHAALHAVACAPRSCTLSVPSSKCARLRRAFNFPFSSTLCSSLPSSRCGKSPGRSQLLFFYFRKEKRKRRNTQHASLNTHCATRFVQHNTRYLGKTQQRADRAQRVLRRWVKINREGKRGRRGEKRRRAGGRGCAPQARR